VRHTEDPILPAAAPARHRNPRWLFLGPHGLRSGWCICAFAAVFLCIEFLLGRLVPGLAASLRVAPAIPLGATLLAEVMQLAGLAFATAVMSAVQRRAFRSFGLEDAAWLWRFCGGLAWGVVAVSALVLALRAGGLLVLEAPQAVASAVQWRNALGWGLTFVLVGTFEECLLWGYLQFTLMRAIRFRWAALPLSLLFGAAHGMNLGETPIGLFTAAGFGLLFCASLWYTGSLFWAIGFHAAWD
jgi:membrane protease YdiL (CAAX protease family)